MWTERVILSSKHLLTELPNDQTPLKESHKLPFLRSFLRSRSRNPGLCPQGRQVILVRQGPQAPWLQGGFFYKTSRLLKLILRTLLQCVSLLEAMWFSWAFWRFVPLSLLTICLEKPGRPLIFLNKHPHNPGRRQILYSKKFQDSNRNYQTFAQKGKALPQSLSNQAISYTDVSFAGEASKCRAMEIKIMLMFYHDWLRTMNRSHWNSFSACRPSTITIIILEICCKRLPIQLKIHYNKTSIPHECWKTASPPLGKACIWWGQPYKSSPGLAATSMTPPCGPEVSKGRLLEALKKTSFCWRQTYYLNVANKPAKPGRI